MSRTFRLFVSSTFSDLKAERNALQARVFPKVRELCAAHGARFQAIDLRWGVSQEAALDQQTMKICLEEIARSQRVSPRPNFLVLLGDRYGWRPLPYAIPSDEYRQIEPRFTDAERGLVMQWYRLDKNAVPAVYLLQPREGQFSDYASWEPVEQQLREALQRVSADLAPEARVKYFASATEQEIANGALAVDNASDHVFCFFRQIVGMPAEAAEYRDADENSRLLLEHLKSRLRAKLPGNVSEYGCMWTEQGPSIEHLDRFCEDVWQRLSQVILQELSRLEQLDPLEQEIASHRSFGRDRRRLFTGRAPALQATAGYLSGAHPYPLVIHGLPGSGKSALLAQVAETVQKTQPDAVLVVRFVGATPASSHERTLLEGLCRELTSVCGGDLSAVPTGHEALCREVPELLLKTSNQKPVIVLIDAVDQLTGEGGNARLSWLARQLPPGVRVLLTTTPGSTLQRLKQVLPPESMLELAAMGAKEGEALLDLWLREAGRKLQPPQRGEVLRKFEDCGLPLYLKLAFEQARRWRSFDAPVPLERDIPSMIRDLFARLSERSRHGAVLVSRSLGYLAASRFGLTEDELLDVLSEDSEVLSDFTARSFHTPPERRLPSVVWSRLFFDLEPYLTERVAGGASVLGFYHREFGEEAARTFLPGANARARHAALAGYFGRQSLLAANSPAGTPNLRKLEELPYQQARAELWDELVDTLCDLHFVETKCSAGLTYDLLNDYRVALEQLPEAREDRDLEAGRDLRLKEFVGELIAAAEGRTQSLRIIPSVEPWSAERLQAERRRIEKEPTRLDRARAFSDFAGENTDSLVRFGNRPCFCRQQAYNQAASGPVGRAAEQSIAAEPDHVMLVHPDFLRRTTPGRPALLRRLSQQGIHSGLSLAVSGDMQRAVVEADETLQVWDLISGRLLSTLPDPGKPSSRGVSLSADGTRAATWGGNMLRLWDLRSESCALEFTIPSLKPDHDVQVYALALAPDGRKAMLSLTHGRAGHSIGPAVLQLWDLEKGWCLGTFNEAQLFVFGLAMTPDSRLALTATSDDHVLRLWDVRAGRCLREMAGHSHTVWTVSMTPDGRRAISGGYDMKPRVWDLESGLCLFTFNHDENIRRTAITADGLFGLSAGDATLRLWDLRTGACVRKIAEGAPAAALSADGRRALTCGNALQLWDIERGEAYAAVEESAGAFVRVVPAGKRVIVERQGGDVRVLDPGSGKCLSTLDAGAERGHPDSVSIGPGGRRAVSRFAMKYHIWDLEQGRLHCSIAASPFVKNVYVTPDGARAVSVDLQMWSLDSGEELKIPGVHPEYGDEAAIGPGGRAVVSLGRDKKIRTWDLHRRQCRTTIEAPFLSTLPHPLALTPDGRAIVAPVREGDHVVIQAWDIQQGNCLRAIESVSGGYTNTILAMSPDGRRVVTSHMDRPICTWNLRTGACMGTMEACGKFFFGMSITPDGRYLASAHDNSLSVWDLETADRVAQYQAPRGIWGPAWVESSSGYFLVCGSKEGMLLLMAKNMPSGTSAFVTPVRLWLFGEGDTGSWSDRITADCAWCGSRMAVSDPVLDAIHAIGREARLPEGAPPCLNLPSEAWEQPRLRGECPACRRAVRFNPFIADEREFLQ